MLIPIGTLEYIGKPIKTDETCPNCGVRHNVMVVPYYEYVYIFFIPTYPFSKKVFVRCNNCGQAFYNVGMEDLTDDVKKQIKTPRWQYTGIILTFILFIGILMFCLNLRSDRIESQKTETIEVGNIYEVSTAYSEYSVLKVIAISDDSIFLNTYEYGVYKESAIGIKQPLQKYDYINEPETIIYLKSDFIEERDKNKITKLSKRD